MRPFEVGDMVVLDDNQTAFVLDCSLRMVFVELCSGGQYHFYEHNIKTIRKPRKGSKEARDIVAMLARKYKSLLHDYLEYWWHDQNASDDDIKKYWNHRRDGGQFRNHERYLTFQTAKSMLK